MPCEYRKRASLTTAHVDVSISNPPRTGLWVNIPDECRMYSEFEIGDSDLPDIKISFDGSTNDTEIVFERTALERFIGLAQRTLAIPATPSSPCPDTRLMSSYGYEIREQSRFAAP